MKDIGFENNNIINLGKIAVDSKDFYLVLKKIFSKSENLPFYYIYKELAKIYGYSTFTRSDLKSIIGNESIISKNILKEFEPVIGNGKPQQVYVKRKDWVFEDERFIALWNKIKQKTIYRINLDIDAFMKRCIESIAHMMPIEKAKIKKQTAIIDIRKEGVDYKEQGIRYTDIEQSVQLPDVVRIISTATKLPRSNVAKILIESNRLNDFINNPQKYIEQVIYYINYHKSTMSIDGIKYTKVEGQEYSYMDVFNTEDTREIIAYLDSNALPVDKSVYDYVIYDSETVEKPFAEALDNDEDVKLFFKIPKRFTIDTPVGSYTPDWAVYVETENEKKLYFVIETKGTDDISQSRGVENIKISCGKAHFYGLGVDVTWAQAKKWAECKKRYV